MAFYEFITNIFVKLNDLLIKNNQEEKLMDKKY